MVGRSAPLFLSGRGTIAGFCENSVVGDGFSMATRGQVSGCCGVLHVPFFPIKPDEPGGSMGAEDAIMRWCSLREPFEG